MDSSSAACPNCGSPLGVGGCTYAFCQNHNGPTKSAAQICEFGCGPDTDESYVRPGYSIAPACPVHGWMVDLLNERSAAQDRPAARPHWAIRLRLRLLLPWSCRWNAWLRDVTARWEAS